MQINQASYPCFIYNSCWMAGQEQAVFRPFETFSHSLEKTASSLLDKVQWFTASIWLAIKVAFGATFHNSYTSSFPMMSNSEFSIWLVPAFNSSSTGTGSFTRGLFWAWRIELGKGGQLPFGANTGSIKKFFRHNIKNGGISYLLKVHENVFLLNNIL